MAAKCLCAAVLRKSADHGLRAGAVQDLLHLLPMQVAQVDHALSVQTAGDDGAIAKDADLIAESVAGASLAVVGGAGQ